MSRLRDVDIPNGENDSYAVCAFLTCLGDAIQLYPDITIYNIEVAYLNKERLNNNIERQLRFFCQEFQHQQEAATVQGSPLPANTIDNFEAKLKEIEANLSNCRLVTNAVQFYKATKCNYFLVASAPNCCWI
jgi:hypothetical protein